MNSLETRRKVSLVSLSCIVALSIACQAICANDESLPAPPPTIEKKPLSGAQIKVLGDKISAAKDMGTLVNLEKQVAVKCWSNAIRPERARTLLEQIVESERQLVGSERLEVAHGLNDIANSFPLEQQKDAISLRREALSIALKKSPPMDSFVLEVRSSLARELVLTHAKKSHVTEICPSCPHCQNNAFVVPVFGFIPFKQSDYDYGFVNRVGERSGAHWYCRKCKGAFFPYTTKEEIMDEKPL